MPKQEDKVAISLRAFESRMKRHMQAAHNEEMKVCRHDSRWFQDMGPYYFVHCGTNAVERRGIGLETLIDWAREGGVLKAYETVDLSA